MGKLVDQPTVHTMADSDYVLGVFGNAGGKMTIEEFRRHLNDNDEEVLNDLAFYIDINVASGDGSTRVNVGGNMHMRALWENAGVSVLMDANGNYCELNRNDNRYTDEGTYILNGDGTLISAFAGADMMKIRPQSYGRIQTKTVGATTVLRQWLSLSPLPGGYIIPQMVVGKFKCNIVDSKLRSIPGVVPSGSQTISAFWGYAQARSKSHGLANLNFRNYLLYHMMSKYAYRDSQNAKAAGDNSPIWGVGLDGSENTTSSADDGFTRQKNIKTGATLRLGENDGNFAVTDSAGGTCHSVNVVGFENPWGQYWEMVQGLCSVGTDVYCWDHNFMPPASPAPTADTFASVEHVMLTRATTANVTKMNIIASENGQGSYMIPDGSISGISYGDYYSYDANGQLWLFGGTSNRGSNCGLACADSNNGWSSSHAALSARLAYYGDVRKVTEARLRELLS